MRVILTAREIMDRGIWDEFCQLRGINPYGMKEGLMDSSDEFSFTEDEAVNLRILPRTP